MVILRAIAFIMPSLKFRSNVVEKNVKSKLSTRFYLTAPNLLARLGAVYKAFNAI
jgi:hypothetical protein